MPHPRERDTSIENIAEDKKTSRHPAGRRVRSGEPKASRVRKKPTESPKGQDTSSHRIVRVGKKEPAAGTERDLAKPKDEIHPADSGPVREEQHILDLAIEKKPVTSTDPGQPNDSTREASRAELAENGVRLIHRALRAAKPTLHTARVNDDPDRLGRIQRRRAVHERLITTYHFLDSIEGVPPASLDEALDRFETLTELLVHPTIDDIMQIAVKKAGFPDDVAVGLIGSGASGAALVRTLSAQDPGLDSFNALPKHPNIDTALISLSPVPYKERVNYTYTLDNSLRKFPLAQCKIHNLSYDGYSLEESERSLQEGAFWEIEPINYFFYPIYPKEAGVKIRRSVVDNLTELGRENPYRLSYVIPKLRGTRRDKSSFTYKHFGLRDPLPTTSTIPPDRIVQQVSAYFSDKILRVYFDLLDMTRPEHALTVPE